uniref:Uncharacterized protein n=1 Tax=Chromera velia CCMP2878 TaxID=1169474 RepID=A0A0G4F3L4_9ALVE|eukprot:Cvel_14825.t1-p1 / transcript=Cvel_14825.t1 / gene=Cvel_14825 / organism=Chromera_velia_CCMP2878 / gene_product=hypothetical protein / transcript_product=hypothetical protein / location=Cvel_scaffold1070:9541-16383(-) / protein_length=834 / sequence_SO=supercontig / SO=protein_coding / is_pseudo=false
MQVESGESDSPPESSLVAGGAPGAADVRATHLGQEEAAPDNSSLSLFVDASNFCLDKAHRMTGRLLVKKMRQVKQGPAEGQVTRLNEFTLTGIVLGGLKPLNVGTAQPVPACVVSWHLDDRPPQKQQLSVSTDAEGEKGKGAETTEILPEEEIERILSRMPLACDHRLFSDLRRIPLPQKASAVSPPVILDPERFPPCAPIPPKYNPAANTAAAAFPEPSPEMFEFLKLYLAELGYTIQHQNSVGQTVDGSRSRFGLSSSEPVNVNDPRLRFLPRAAEAEESAALAAERQRLQRRIAHSQMQAKRMKDRPLVGAALAAQQAKQLAAAAAQGNRDVEELASPPPAGGATAGDGGDPPQDHPERRRGRGRPPLLHAFGTAASTSVVDLERERGGQREEPPSSSGAFRPLPRLSRTHWSSGDPMKKAVMETMANNVYWWKFGKGSVYVPCQVCDPWDKKPEIPYSKEVMKGQRPLYVLVLSLDDLMYAWTKYNSLKPFRDHWSEFADKCRNKTQKTALLRGLERDQWFDNPMWKSFQEAGGWADDGSPVPLPDVGGGGGRGRDKDKGAAVSASSSAVIEAEVVETDDLVIVEDKGGREKREREERERRRRGGTRSVVSLDGRRKVEESEDDGRRNFRAPGRRERERGGASLRVRTRGGGVAAAGFGPRRSLRGTSAASSSLTATRRSARADAEREKEELEDSDLLAEDEEEEEDQEPSSAAVAEDSQGGGRTRGLRSSVPTELLPRARRPAVVQPSEANAGRQGVKRRREESEEPPRPEGGSGGDVLMMGVSDEGGGPRRVTRGSARAAAAAAEAEEDEAGLDQSFDEIRRRSRGGG